MTERAEIVRVGHAEIVGQLEVAAWLHWCGAATPGDPATADNTVDGLPAPCCSGCRFEVPLHKAGDDELTLLYRRVEGGGDRSLSATALSADATPAPSVDVGPATARASEAR